MQTYTGGHLCSMQISLGVNATVRLQTSFLARCTATPALHPCPVESIQGFSLILTRGSPFFCRLLTCQQ